MAAIQDILAVKGGHLNTVSPEATVLDAAILMNDHKIGSLLVMEDGKLIGILTERDILHRIVAEQRNPAATRVGAVMTRDMICARPHTEINEARSVMKNRRIRHLPVLSDEEELVGLISIGDLNAFQADCQERTIYLLQEYIHGTW